VDVPVDVDCRGARLERLFSHRVWTDTDAHKNRTSGSPCDTGAGSHVNTTCGPQRRSTVRDRYGGADYPTHGGASRISHC